jgi:hypothetical protein
MGESLVKLYLVLHHWSLDAVDPRPESDFTMRQAMTASTHIRSGDICARTIILRSRTADSGRVRSIFKYGVSQPRWTTIVTHLDPADH